MFEVPAEKVYAVAVRNVSAALGITITEPSAATTILERVLKVCAELNVECSRAEN